jgi:hypothetical protein
MSEARRPWKGVFILLVVALVAILIGCGGGGGGGGGLTGVTGATTATDGGSGGAGSLVYTIEWPTATPSSRTIPTYAKSVVISIYNLAEQLIDQRTINRTQDGPYSVNINFNLPAGSYTVICEAKSGTDGGGSTLAEDTFAAQVIDGQETDQTLDFTTTINQLFIDDLPSQVNINHTIQVGAHAEDSEGNQFALPKAALDWSIVDGAEFASITPDGQLTLSSVGSVTIQVREIETDIIAQKTITLVEGTTNGVIVIVN